MIDADSPFSPAALDANKSGRLTDAQRKALRAQSRGTRKGELSFALLALVIGGLILVGARSSVPIGERLGIPLLCLLIAAVLVFRAVLGADKLTRDLRNPRVESLEGPISKNSSSTSSGNSSSTTYYLHVAGRRFTVGAHAYRAAPEAGFVRIYFLSNSRHVVNLERLADQSLPEGTTPHALMREFGQVLRSHDRAKIDELRAEMAGTENAMQAVISHDAAPPPPAPLDGRALADGIIGTWSGGPITVIFNGDGSLSITILGANQQTGRWSVNPNGKLVADLAGREQTTDAWLAGDQLTISLGGDTITLTRSAH